MTKKMLSSEQRGYLYAHLESGIKYTHIQRKFEDKYSRRVSLNTLTRMKNTYVPQLNRRGRKSKVSERLKEKMVSYVKKNSSESWNILTNRLNNMFRTNICFSTLRKICKAKGVKSYRIQNKLLINSRIAKGRLEFCKKLARKPITEIRKWGFSDEKTFYLKSSKNYYNKYVKTTREERYTNPNIIPVYKYNFSGVKVWGLVTYNGVSKLCFTNKWCSKEYHRIITDYIKPAQLKLGFTKLLSDNDRPKTSGSSLAKLRTENIKLVENYPACLPETNIIECVWYHLERQIRRHNISDIEDLKTKLVEGWRNLDIGIIRSLIDSIKRRAQEIINKNGYNTKY